MVGRTPRSAADAPVGLLAPFKMLISLDRLRDEDSPPFVNVFFEFFFESGREPFWYGDAVPIPLGFTAFWPTV